MSRKLDTSKMFYREMKIEQESVSEEERSFEISFSSETPVPRWGTDEILDHSAGAVDLTRLQLISKICIVIFIFLDQTGIVCKSSRFDTPVSR